MLQIEIIDAYGASRLMQTTDECVIGKGGQNEIHLDSWRVSKEHARLFTTPAGVLLDDLGGFGGITVNSQRIEHQYGPLKSSDVIGIGPFKLLVTEIGTASDVIHTPPPHYDSTVVPQRTKAANEIHTSHRGTEPTPQQIVLQQRSGDQESKAFADVHMPAASAGFALVSVADLKHKALEFEWRKRIHGKLLETMDLRRHDVSSMTDQHLRSETEALLHQILKAEAADLPHELDRALLCRQVLNEAVGLGPLEELLEDDSVSEVMVNRFDEIYIERGGRLQKHPLTFTGDRAVLGVIERIVAPLGRRIDESSPMVDARLKDGSRVNAIIPPLALKGPTLTIRKFARHKLDANALVQFGSISSAMAEFLKVCVASLNNIIVSGGTVSGKTTLLNILSNFIPTGERVITVEDAAELKLHHEHLISLESRPANVEGKGAVHIRDLVKNTLRMRPDRIVVGECRGAEALDMLQAMNTGHEGSLTTLHANTPRDGLARLETMVLMAGMDLPLIAIREQIASAVDVIVQQTRFACGTRMVTSITEITGMESGKIQIQELFKFANQGYRGCGGKVQGYFTGCDMVPGFYEELRAAGHDFDMDIFKPAMPLARGNDAMDGDERQA